MEDYALEECILPFLFSFNGPKFVKGSNLRMFDIGANAIICVLYKYFSTIIFDFYFIFLSISHLLNLMPFFYSRYIHRTLLRKDVVIPTFVVAYFNSYVDKASKKFIYTRHQFDMILFLHLKAGG